MNQILHTFGNRLRALRTAKGITQEALAEESHCHPNYIGGIERGERNPTLLKITMIARALEVDVAELMRGVR